MRRNRLAKLLSLKKMILKEVKSSSRLRFRNKLKAWRRGFFSETFIHYNLAENNFRNYLSDFQVLIRTPYINREYSVVLNNKYIFHSMLIPYREYLPKIYFVISNGKTFYQAHSTADVEFHGVESLLARQVNFVIKPFYGGGGKGIYIIKNHDKSVWLNGTAVKASDIIRMCNILNAHLVTEYLSQADYSSTIYPQSLNTIRILTMWDVHHNKPFVAAAMHRFGTRKSSPLDNLERGGLSAAIDIESGVLGRAVPLSGDTSVKWFDRHPESGSPIKGIKIPRWEEVKSKLLNIAHSLPMMPYIGWDIVVQNQAIKIVEGNNHSRVIGLQVHGPLLREKRIVEFYKHYGVIK